MMSMWRWTALWLLFMGYLFLGAFLFYSIERRYEEYRRLDENPEKLDIEDLLNRYYTWSNNKAHKELLTKLNRKCNITVLNPSFYTDQDNGVNMEEEFQWTFYNSFFFALTTLSTIGYGNLHPTSCLGRMLVIVYSLIGIPFNGIVLTQLGEFFASTFLRVHQRYKGKRFETRFVLIVDIATYLIPGIVLFIFLPSGIFVYFEGWTFEQSIYFAYVTLTTIGYGDFVAGQLTKDKWYGIYKVVLIFWIMFGLGYLVMILGFISRAMRCKQMARLERKVAQNLKHTHSKILNEFNRDVTYIRRMLNELYLLKFKPVYQDERPICDLSLLARCRSAPNLTEWPILRKRPEPIEHSSSSDEEETRMQFEKQRMKRRKALVENLYKHSSLRVRSETDLTKIDREATFNCASLVERNELMERVVDAYHTTYSGIQSSNTTVSTDYDDGRSQARKVSRFEKILRGIDGFTDEEILSGELTDKDWETIKNEKQPTYSEQWTWSAGENSNLKLSSSKDSQREYAEKRRSLQLPGVQRIRRISLAALNFLSPSKSQLTPKSGAFSSDVDLKDVEQGHKSIKEPVSRARKTSKSTCPSCKTSKKRYSVCDVDYDQMYECIDRYTKEVNTYAALRNQIGNLENAVSTSPLLEQTSISDFLLIVNSLSANAASQGSAKSTKVPSLFSLFEPLASKMPLDNLRLAPPSSAKTDRRYSLYEPKNNSDGRVNRHKSFSSNVRRLSPVSRPIYERPRSTSTHSARRRISSESTSNVRTDWSKWTMSSTPSQTPSSSDVFSKKIRRFLVKPVTMSPPVPEIVISSASPVISRRASTRAKNDDDIIQSERL